MVHEAPVPARETRENLCNAEYDACIARGGTPDACEVVFLNCMMEGTVD